MTDLKRGLKVYAHYTSCTKGQQVYNLLIEEGIIDHENSIYYSSNETIKPGEELTNNKKLNNINEEWGRLKYISSTSTLTVGNSYTNKDVDAVYIFGGANSCCVRDSFQNHMRIRHNMGALNIFILDRYETFKPTFLNYMNNEETLNNDLKEIQKQNYFKYNLELNEIYYLLKHETITDNKLKQY